MRLVIIVANGEPPEPEPHWNRIRRADPLICTDGAANWLVENDVTPDIIIGDLDSLEERIKSELNPESIHQISTQENTDLEKAILYAIDNGYNAATILGATGKREDQTLGNLYLLVQYADQINLQLLTNYSTIEAISGDYTFRPEQGQTISLLPVGAGSIVTTEGLEYPLRGEPLEIGTRGISNRAVSDEVTIRVENGPILLFRNF